MAQDPGPRDDGASFLTTKQLLLMSYCRDLCSYAGSKVRGKPLDYKGCPKRLLEIGTIMEKIRPMERYGDTLQPHEYDSACVQELTSVLGWMFFRVRRRAATASYAMQSFKKTNFYTFGGTIALFWNRVCLNMTRNLAPALELSWKQRILP